MNLGRSCKGTEGTRIHSKGSPDSSSIRIFPQSLTTHKPWLACRPFTILWSTHHDHRGDIGLEGTHGSQRQMTRALRHVVRLRPCSSNASVMKSFRPCVLSKFIASCPARECMSSRPGSPSTLKTWQKPVVYTQVHGEEVDAKRVQVQAGRERGGSEIGGLASSAREEVLERGIAVGADGSQRERLDLDPRVCTKGVCRDRSTARSPAGLCLWTSAHLHTKRSPVSRPLPQTATSTA
ncbi:hypothetical protein BKA63DRAFT_527043 [Paraphoma chrysanthemicola]|nr:hypothetical protein BKA63DRAFT_527043 [Paraphoma chrysanthemicola]